MAEFLQTPLKVGDKTLKSRIVMAPLTRVRAYNTNDESLQVSDRHVEYYSQRASDGALLISEATVATPWSIASSSIPAIFNENQALAWKKVVDAVHAKGGLFSSQLWFQGALAHQTYANHPLAIEANAKTCVGPSPHKVDMIEVDYITGSRTPYETAHELTIGEIHTIQDQYCKSAEYALDVAGFDYIEVHAAHQYGFEQFCSGEHNRREDKYGQDKALFLREIVERLVKKYPGKIAVRISPHLNYNSLFGANDPKPVVTFTNIINVLRDYDLAYLLVTEPLMSVDTVDPTCKAVNWDSVIDDKEFKPLENIGYLELFREKNNTTPVFAAGGWTPCKINYYVSNDYKGNEKYKYDGIAIGRYYISNPDLVFRINNGLPLNLYDRTTFYTEPTIIQSDGITKKFDPSTFSTGYTDYPTFEEICQAKGMKMEEVMNDVEKMKALIDATQNDPYPLVSIEDIGVTSNRQQLKFKMEAQKKREEAAVTAVAKAE